MQDTLISLYIMVSKGTPNGKLYHVSNHLLPFYLLYFADVVLYLSKKERQNSRKRVRLDVYSSIETEEINPERVG